MPTNRYKVEATFTSLDPELAKRAYSAMELSLKQSAFSPGITIEQVRLRELPADRS
jgi:hypothetical protein